MRLVLDTSVVVAALRSDTGVSRVVLNHALAGRFELLLSVPLVLEYEAVLTRFEHLAAIRLSEVDLEAILDSLVAASEPVELAFAWRPVSQDPDDDMVIETAVNGQADAIVSFNTADLKVPCRRFGIDVWKPIEAWRLLEN
jgi:putative PIN family toxin of toxin-antitoxin system